MRRFSRRSAGSAKSGESDPNRPKTPTSTSSSTASRIARGKEKLTGKPSTEDVKSSPKSKGSQLESPRSRKESVKAAPQENEPVAEPAASREETPVATAEEHLKPLPAESVPTPVEEKPAKEEDAEVKNEEKPLPEEVKLEDKSDLPSQEEKNTEWETELLPESEKASQDEVLPVESTPVEEPLPEKSSPETKPAPAKVGSYGQALIASTDNTVSRLNKLVSTAYGQERILASTNYFSQVLHHGLSSHAFHVLLTRVRGRLNLPAPGENPLTAKGPSGRPPLLALSDLMTETRTTIRLFGLLGIWSWGASLLRQPPTDPFLRKIAYSQVLACGIYQFMENVAYLATKGILSERLVDKWGGIGRWYIWSTRAWLGHVLLELVRLARERQLSAAANSEKKTTEKKKDIVDFTLDPRLWKKSLVNNLAWMPLCFHWSAEEGVGVSDGLVSVLGFTAGAWALTDSWRGTARQS